LPVLFYRGFIIEKEKEKRDVCGQFFIEVVVPPKFYFCFIIVYAGHFVYINLPFLNARLAQSLQNVK
jgi:hypothetical protein